MTFIREGNKKEKDHLHLFGCRDGRPTERLIRDLDQNRKKQEIMK